MKLLMPSSVPEGLLLDPDQEDVEVVVYDQDASIPPGCDDDAFLGAGQSRS